MRMINKHISFLFAVFGFVISCALLPQHLQFSDENDPIADLNSKKIKDSIVSIKSQSGLGTGFFVAYNKIVTNIHVIAYPGDIEIKSAETGKIWTVEGVAAYDIVNDLVILKVSGKSTPFSLGKSHTVQSGETMYVGGYSDAKYSVDKGLILNIRNSDKWMFMKIDITSGSSGSPVLNNKGQVIGVIGEGLESYYYAIHSEAIRPLLKRTQQIEPLEQW